MRSRLSVENPGTLQIILEDGVGAIVGLLEEWIGPTGRKYLPLIGTLGIFILCGNYMGLVPGPDGADEQHQRHARLRDHDLGLLPFPGHSKSRAIVNYMKHFAVPPGAPGVDGAADARRSRSSATRRGCCRCRCGCSATSSARSWSSSFSFSIVPFLVPLPMMFLGLVTGGLQAFIFVLLSIIYLQGAVAVDITSDDATGMTRRAARTRRRRRRQPA